MTPGQIQQLIDAVKSASPAIWAAAQHQVQAQIVQDWLWVTIFAVISVIALVFTVLGIWLIRSAENSYDDRILAGILIAVIAGMVLIAALIFLGVEISDLIAKTQAGDYAAIKNITDLIPAPPHQ